MIFIGNNNVVDEATAKKAINIRSLHSDSLYRVNNGYKYKFKKKDDEDAAESSEEKETDDEYVEQDAFLNWGQAVLSHSLFSEYMKKHGMTVREGRRLRSREMDNYQV